MRGAAGALLAVALVLGGCGASAEPGQQTRPNVLVLLTDDQTIESMRVMAGVRAELGASGTTFEQSFVSNPLCCPSRATLYTGQYAHNHGVLGNRPPEGGYGRLDKSEWLPVWLQRAGYHTVHIGKFMNRYGLDSPPTEVPPGWNEWYTSVDPSTYSFTDYQLNENGVVSWGQGYSTDEYTERAVDAVERLAPSARAVLPLGRVPGAAQRPSGGVRRPGRARHPDAGAAAPRRVRRGGLAARRRRSTRRTCRTSRSFVRRLPRLSAERTAAIREMYQQELESLLAVDEGIVRVVRRPSVGRRAREHADRVHVGQRLLPRRAPRAVREGDGVRALDPGAAVLRGPGVPAGERRRQLVTNADLAPTILEAAGAVPAGRVPDGRSLFPLLRDRGLAWGRELLVEGAPGFQAVAYAALRNDRFVYAEHDNGERELYDLRRDPASAGERDRAAALRRGRGTAGGAAGGALGVRGPVVPARAAPSLGDAGVPGAGEGSRAGARARAPERAAPARARRGPATGGS